MLRQGFLSLLILSTFFIGGAWLEEQAPQNPVLSRYRFFPQSDSQMRKIAERFSVEHRHGNAFEILVPVPQTQEFFALASGAELLQADISADFDFLEDGDAKGFHTFETVAAEIQKIAAAHPDLAVLDTYGKSMEGRPLYVLRLSSKNGAAKKTQIALSAATHGNEISTVEVVMGILNHLVQKNGLDPRVTALLEKYEIYFLPVINPDGYVRRERFANGVDPNREYPWPQNPNRNPNPCIRNVMQFFANHDIKGSIDFHSKGGMIMYPWAYTYQGVKPEDKTFFDQTTAKMAGFNHYVHGPIATVIYIAPGSSADYYYWKFGTRSLGIELSGEGSSSFVPALLNENLESTLAFIESL